MRPPTLICFEITFEAVLSKLSCLETIPASGDCCWLQRFQLLRIYFNRVQVYPTVQLMENALTLICKLATNYVTTQNL